MTDIINRHARSGIDKLGDTYEVWYTNSITSVPALHANVLRQFADLIDAGHAPSGSPVPFGSNSSSVYIKYGNTIAASLTYRIDGDLAWIIFTMINDQFQRRGLYTQLHQSFEFSALRNKCTRAGSMLHIDNTRIQEISRINGYEPEYTRMVKKLP